MGVAFFFLFACLFPKEISGIKQGSKVSGVGDGFEVRKGNQFLPLTRKFGIAKWQIHSWEAFIGAFLLHLTGWEELLIKLFYCASKN